MDAEVEPRPANPNRPSAQAPQPEPPQPPNASPLKSFTTRNSAPPRASHPRETGPSLASPTNGHPASNGHPYPQPSEIWPSVVTHLQTQVAYNTNIIGQHKRDIERIDGAVARLQHEMNHIMGALEELRMELRSKLLPSQQPPPPHNPPDSTDLEILSSNLQSVSDKASEIDGLKMQVDLMKRRIKKLEEGKPDEGRVGTSFSSQREPSVLSQPPPSQQAQPLHPPPRNHGPPPPHMQHSLHSQAPVHIEPRPPPGYQHVEPQSMPQPMSHPVSSWRPAAAYQPPATPQYQSSATLDHPYPRPPEPEPQSSGWTSVNSSTKRGPPAVHGGHAEELHINGSPKRPKLSSNGKRSSYAEESEMQVVGHNHMDTDNPLEVRNQIQSNGSQPEPPHSNSANAYTFVPFHSTNERNTDNNWRQEPQRARSPPLRGGRGGGRGYRPYRPRKSAPVEQLGTPEWEKSDWTGSQISPDGFYQPHSHSDGTPYRTTLVRRSGGGRGSASSARVAGSPSESRRNFEHTKKSRTKPIRNAEGVLIRKDGRPDMRSVSSAQNLRKVHAKKEGERAHQSHTPTSGLAMAPVLGTDSTPERSEAEGEGEDGAPPNTQERHRTIMRKMFPGGLKEQREELVDPFFMGSRSTSPARVKVEGEAEAEAEEQYAESVRDVEQEQGHEQEREQADEEEHDERMVGGDEGDETAYTPAAARSVSGGHGTSGTCSSKSPAASP
ncbi:hypothetical protein LTR04_002060 [Oleoguttula sp. CCFEE 6159]|nr:hypothetical protein LTR04_002060 [Oleoguttula sp. CCFEE 6159]